MDVQNESKIIRRRTPRKNGPYYVDFLYTVFIFFSKTGLFKNIAFYIF